MRHAASVALLLALAVPAFGKETAESWAEWSRAYAESLEKKSDYDDAVGEWLALAKLLPNDLRPLSRAAVLSVEIPTMLGKNLERGSPAAAVAEACIREAGRRG